MTRIMWNTQLVAEEMKKENCELIDEYLRGDIRIKYLYEGNEYTVRWNDWCRKNRPARPHLNGGNKKRTKWTTELVAEEMKRANCELIDEYKRADVKIKYLYEGKEYTIRWHDWLRNIKPHLNRGNHNHTIWTTESVNELLKRDDCELVGEFVNVNTRIKYKYQDSIYWVTLHSWISNKARPHFCKNENENRFREYLEENNISFETQKIFDDLISPSNRKLRFDFYIPEFNLLVEIDDQTHFYMDQQIEYGKLKDKYCEEHKIKLLRIDETVTKNNFDDLLCKMIDDDIYIFKYGKLYKNVEL